MAGLTPTQRTLRALRDRGLVCAIVEKFNAYAGPHGLRQDLFGIIDVLALDPEHGVIGVQSCGQDFSAHLHKLTEEKAQETSDWLRTPGTSLELWGWRKVKLKRGGLAMRWQPRVAYIQLSDLGITFGDACHEVASVEWSDDPIDQEQPAQPVEAVR